METEHEFAPAFPRCATGTLPPATSDSGLVTGQLGRVDVSRLMAPPLPRSVADVDAAWMTAALASRFPGIAVAQVTHGQVIHGAATKVLIKLTYAEHGRAIHLPETMWAKSGWEAHSDWLNSATAIDARETRFYKDLAARVDVNVPGCYYADWSDTGHGIVLLEDLNERPVTFGAPTATVGADEVAGMLDHLARLHARWWENQRDVEVRFLDRPMRRNTPSASWALRNGPDVIEQFLATPRCAQVPSSVRDPLRIDRAFWAMIDHMGKGQGETGADAYCVLHGDAHPGNTFFDVNGAPGLYDWQTISFGPWAHDVSYYLTSAMNVAERRASDRDLIRHYLEALRRYGVTSVPTFDQAWLSHRRYIAYGLHIWISNPSHFQSEENCTAMVTRLGAAAEDYDFFSAWNV